MYFRILLMFCFLLAGSIHFSFADSSKTGSNQHTSVAVKEGFITVSVRDGRISLKAEKSSLEDILQKISDQQKIKLNFYCNDPAIKSDRVSVERNNESMPELLAHLLGDANDFIFVNPEIGSAGNSGDISDKEISVYPRDCSSREQPVRVFQNLGRHPLLTKTHDEITVEDLSLVLAKEGPSARKQAVYILGIKGDKDSIPLVKKALMDDNPDVMIEAARVLKRLGRIQGAENVSDTIAARLQEKPYPELLIALASLDKEKSLPFIEMFINMPDPKGQDAALRALSLTKDKRAIELLSNISQGDDIENSRQAILTMGKMDTPEAAAAIIKLLREGDTGQQAIAAQSAFLMSQEIGSEARKEVEHLIRKGDVSDELITALVDISYLKPLGILMSDISSKKDLKIRALRIMGMEGTSVTIETITIGLEDKDVEIRLEALKAMSSIATDNAIIHLVKATEDRDAKVRRAAIKGLAGFSASEMVVSALSGRLNDRDSAARKEAIDAFDTFGRPDKNIVSILNNAKVNSDPYVSQKAAYILEKWGLN